ncbi:hypothetical protein B0H11DRAFT_1762521, partial [Mycena galericulata]
VDYRVYTEDEAIPSKTAFHQADPFQRRIRGRSVPPPHTTETLKRCLAHAEGFSDPLGQRTKLYRKPFATYPMRAEDVFGTGIATWDGSSLALKILDLTAEETTSVEEINIPQSQELDPPYLYYHLYTQTGEATSKVAFDPCEPAIGRIERFRIPVPLSAGSIKRCIAKTEGKPIYAYSHLLLNIHSTGYLYNQAPYPFIIDQTAGSTPDEPMVLLQPERR